MKKNRILRALLILLAPAVLAQAEQPPNAPEAIRIAPAFLNRLAEEARTNHPALQAARAKFEAARYNVMSVRQWDDPMFRFGGFVADASGPNLDMEGDLYYEMEQKLPLFGKPRLLRKVADAEQAVALANADYAFQLLRRELASAILQLALADVVVAVSQQDSHWLETMAEIAEQRYLSGESSQFDVLKLQNEKAGRVDQLRTDVNERDRERWSVNRLLNRKLDSPWPVLELPQVAAPVAFSVRLLELAVGYEPKLKVMKQEVYVASNQVASTRRQRIPDLALGVEGRQFSGDGQFREGMFSVRINLPWFNVNKYRYDIARDQEKLKAARLDSADYELSVRDEAYRTTTRLDAARRQAILYRDEILPRAEQMLSVSHAAWTANRGLLIDVMEARRFLLEAKLKYARAVTEQYQMLSDLVLCCGLADLEALDMLAQQPEASATPAPIPSTLPNQTNQRKR